MIIIVIKMMMMMQTGETTQARHTSASRTRTGTADVLALDSRRTTAATSSASWAAVAATAVQLAHTCNHRRATPHTQKSATGRTKSNENQI